MENARQHEHTCAQNKTASSPHDSALTPSRHDTSAVSWFRFMLHGNTLRNNVAERDDMLGFLVPDATATSAAPTRAPCGKTVRRLERERETTRARFQALPKPLGPHKPSPHTFRMLGITCLWRSVLSKASCPDSAIGKWMSELSGIG